MPTWLELLGTLSLSLLLGGMVGLERELRRRWAGLRTHMMVALGAAIFCVVGKELVHDLGHVVAGITTGIGFIGGGTILKLNSQQEVKGLTTASSIWMAAGIGTAVGLGLYLIAVLGALLSITVLALGWLLEKQIETKPDAKHNPEN
jgi:putative Mg2+ transporter-C (MgtC) family protein